MNANAAKVFSRQNAIKDGLLIDVSPLAKEVGIRIPVAITKSLFDKHINPSAVYQDQEVNSRLWDVISMLRFAANLVTNTDHVNFETVFLDNDFINVVKMKAIIHQGDNGESVVTIMLPDED